jgi:acyl-CoA thioesterase-1
MNNKKPSTLETCKFCGATLPPNAKCCLRCGTACKRKQLGLTQRKPSKSIFPLTSEKLFRGGAVFVIFLILVVIVGTALQPPAGNKATTPSDNGAITSDNANTPTVTSSQTLYAHRIVTVGDSITQGFADPNNWPYLLKARLGGDWEVINQGVGGYKTADILNHIDSALALNPHFVVILGGTNDLANGAVPLATIEDNIKAISTRVESSGAVPVLCTVTPTNFNSTQRDSLNTWITEYAHSKGYPLIDFYTALENPSNPGYANSTLVMSDGVHPTTAGYNAMANAIDLTIFTGGR